MGGFVIKYPPEQQTSYGEPRVDYMSLIASFGSRVRRIPGAHVFFFTWEVGKLVLVIAEEAHRVVRASLLPEQISQLIHVSGSCRV
jgi:hypothetical protein